MNRLFSYFSKKEWGLWTISVGLLFASYLLFEEKNPATLLVSILGVSSLLFCAKGHPIGQLLMVLFGSFYGVISYFANYYGEMITYLGMTVPMAIYALISWLKNPYHGKKSQVKVNTISQKEWWGLLCLTAVVTVGFFFVLKFLGTPNLFISTLSIATSFSACYLSARRSPYFALIYGLNDVVLIVLWLIASVKEPSYLSVVICFFVFLINDLYGFFSWKKMKANQQGSSR